MKTQSVVISLIALTLSACAHTGYYQHGYGYTGYGSGYGNSGYTVERYYDSPAPSYYYQPGGSMNFGTYYLPSYRSHDHYDRHHDGDRHDNWKHAPHRPEHKPSNMHGDSNRWDADSRQLEHRGHDERRVDHAPRLPQTPHSQLHRIENDLARPRQQLHEMRRNDSGNAERRGQRPESERRGNGERGRDHGQGFGRH